MLPAHLIRSRLALQELVFRILFYQTKLGGEGAGSLPVSLRHRPQPCQIQMGIARRIENRLCRSVHRFHCGAQLLYGFPVRGCPALSVLFEIYGQRELFQSFRNLSRTQRSLIQRLQ